jgi:hypothetical protein
MDVRQEIPVKSFSVAAHVRGAVSGRGRRDAAASGRIARVRGGDAVDVGVDVGGVRVRVREVRVG